MTPCIRRWPSTLCKKSPSSPGLRGARQKRFASNLFRQIPRDPLRWQTAGADFMATYWRIFWRQSSTKLRGNIILTTRVTKGACWAKAFYQPKGIRQLADLIVRSYIKESILKRCEENQRNKRRLIC